MTEQQQKLYDKLLKKVNEYCLGAAAEDVIAAIDALVETYEKPKKRISKTKDQLLVENETYQLMLHAFRYYVDSKEYSIEGLVKSLKALEIIKNKRLDVSFFMNRIEKNPKFYSTAESMNNSILKITTEPLTQEEYELLKEILNNGR